MATKDFSYTLKASYVTTVDTTDADWVSSGSSTGYSGMTSAKKMKKTHNALIFFDTSKFLSDEIINTLKGRRTELRVGTANGSKGYTFDLDDGTLNTTSPYPYGVVTMYTAGVDTSVAKGYTYNQVKSLKKTSDAFPAVSNYSLKAVHYQGTYSQLRGKTTVLRITPFSSSYSLEAGVLNYKDISIVMTATSAIPTVSNNGSSNQFVNALPYTLSMKYNHENGGRMTGYTIKWVASTGQSGSASGVTSVANGGVFNHTFPANTFPGGETEKSVIITFSVSVTSIEGNSSGYTTILSAYSDMVIPSISSASPAGGTQIYKAKTNRFSWQYSDNANWAPSGCTILIQQTGQPNKYFNAGTSNYVDVPLYTLVNGQVTWKIDAKSKAGVVKEFGPYYANAISSTPSVTPTEPINGATFKRANPVTFKWNYSDQAGTPQKQAVVSWKVGSATGSKTVTGADKYCTFPGGTFPEGTVEYTVKVKNDDGVESTSALARAVAQSAIPTVTTTFPTDGTQTNYSQSWSFSWNFTEDVPTGQQSWKIEVFKDGAKVKTYQGTNDVRSATVDAKTFDTGLYTYTLTVTNGDGRTASASSSFNVVKSVPIIEMTYPVGILVKKDSDIIFLWNYSSAPVNVEQTKYTIKIYKQDELDQREFDLIETVERESEKHYHKFAAEHFALGVYYYTLEVENSDGMKTESEMYNFTAIGQTEAPTINEVTNDAMPEVSWTVASQSSYEIEVLDEAGTVVYRSGIVSNASARSHKIDKLLNNGKYNLRERVINEYGYYSEYTDFSFIIDAENENEVAEIFVTIASDYSVCIDYSKPQDKKLYIARRYNEDSPIEILGEFNQTYNDYTVFLNTNYQYAVLNYDVGLKYSVWKNIKVELEGVIVRNADDRSKFVNLWKTASTLLNINKRNSRQKNVYQCLGRTFPVREFGEWKTKERSLQAYVTDSEYKMLTDMHMNASAVLYQASGEYMMCDLEMSDSSDYIGGGKIIDVVLYQIDE